MSHVSTFITVKDGITLPQHGEVTALSVTTFSRTNCAVFVECDTSKHVWLVGGIDDNGIRSWWTDDEHHTPLPPLLCQRINTAIECTAMTLTALASLDTAEVAR